MAQRAVDFRGVLLAEPRVQRDEIAVRIRTAGGAEEPRVPFYVDLASELFGAEWREKFARFRFERGIAPENDEGWPRGKDEVELLMTRLVVRLQKAAV